MNKAEAISKLTNLTEGKKQAPDSTGKHTEPGLQGVTVTYLGQVFDMDVKVVKAKLRNCPTLTVRQRGDKMVTVTYDLATAAAYLVTPAFSTAEYLRGVKRGDLPPALQQTVWDALLKRQKWEEQAGQLWRTDKIREVLGSTFQMMKFTMQLWTETLERQTQMSDQQRKIIQKLVDGLQKELYDALVAKIGENNAGPQLEELAELIGEDTPIQELIATVDTYADEIEQLI